jgi:opacity protein-like surface antigen
MKKILLLTSALTLAAFASSASEGAQSLDHLKRKPHHEQTEAPVVETSPTETLSKTGFYGKIEGGYSALMSKTQTKTNGTISTKAKNKLNMGAAIGYNIDDNFRAELGLNKLGTVKLAGNVTSPAADTFAGKMKAYTLMLRGIYQINLNAPVKPFVLAGIGGANSSYSVSTGNLTTKSRKSLAFELGAGLDMPINDAVVAELSYRYTNIGSPKQTDGNVTFKPTNGFNNVLLGLRFNF